VSVRSPHGSTPQPVPLRAATTSDAERLARAVHDELDGYRSFAPQGWTPPSVSAEVANLRGLLGDERVWCLLAEAAGQVVGQITFLPAVRAVRPVDDPALAHLRNLFVRRDRWGTGLAGALHAAAVEAARERGFAQMRLFTPAAHARARRFYEREGWVAAGDEFHDPGPDLVLVEYRCALGDRGLHRQAPEQRARQVP
jgi:GNAT superfamily N-acetyltransferase